jgi:hypothetical protein
MVFIRVVADVTIDFGGIKEPIEQKDVELATGSGFLVAPSGLVLTSNHVVAEQGTRFKAPARGETAEVRVENRRIEALLPGEGGVRALAAWVAAADAETDLAALQIAVADAPYLPLGDSDAVETGGAVRVLGFPFGRSVEVGRQTDAGTLPAVTVTAGSLSAAREDDAGDRRYLQTDASVQPGNSGGPMLDPDGYVVGVVRMKLARDATSSGAGFSVPVNMVKDFLDAHGLLGQLPVGRLRAGVVHSLDWKRLSIELPDGFQDGSPSRLRAELGQIEGIEARIDRVATPFDLGAFELALLAGALPAFAPGRVVRQERLAAGREQARVTLGFALGDGVDGQRLRVEYALADLANEKVVARFAGPADAIAFNLGLLRRALRSFAAGRMLYDTRPGTPLIDRAGGRERPFVEAHLPRGAGAIPMPAEWVVEPVEGAPCEGSPAADAAVAASHAGNYTLVLRAWAWERTVPDAQLVPCTAVRRQARFGLETTLRGELVRRGGRTLLLELEAPTAREAELEPVFEAWLREVQQAR